MRTLVAFTALAACARKPETRTPPQPDPPPQPEPPEVTEPPAEPPATDEPDEPARERRHGAIETVTPPDPPRHEVDVYGGESDRPFGFDPPGCLPVFEPKQPSYVRNGRRSLVRLRTATVVEGTGDIALRLLAGRAAALRSCHLEAMEVEPTAAGDLRLRLDIGANGGVLAVVVESSALPIEACARETALNWRFPKDEPATITATFELRTKPAPPERPAKPRCRK